MESLESVESYINEKKDFPIKSKLVETKKLSGGLVNFVYRLVYENKETAILKYFPTFLASNRSIEMSQNRYFVEKAALELLGNNEELKTSIRVPKLLYSDDNAFVLVMEDAGEHTKSLFQILQTKTDAKEVNLGELITKLAKELHNFSKFLSEKSGISPTSHKSQFENKSAWDIKQTYFIPLYKNEAKKYELERELQQHIDKAEEIVKPPSDDKGVLVIGDLWQNSILIDLEKQHFWIIDWEEARFETPTSDLEQFISNLWIMKQNAELFNAELIEKLIKRLQFEFFGDENTDYRTKCGANAKTNFILWTLVLVRIPHWEIKDMKSCIVKALSEIN